MSPLSINPATGQLDLTGSSSGGSGTVTSVSLSPASIGSVTDPNVDPIVTINKADATTDGYLDNADFANFQAAFDAISDTANRFAGYGSSGVLEAFGNWVRNPLFGATVNQSPSLTDTGFTASAVLNQNATTVFPTNDLTNTYIYQNLTQVELGGNFDYVAFTGHEFSISQTGASDITNLSLLFPRVTLGVGGGTNTSSNVNVIDSRIRLSGGHAGGTVKGISSIVQLDGATSATEITGLYGSTYSGGTVDYAFGINSLAQIASGATLNQVLYGSNIGSQIDATGIANEVITQRLFHSGNMTGNLTGQILSIYNTSVGTDLKGHAAYLDASVTGHLILFDSGTTNTVGGSFTGYYLNDGTTTTGQKILFCGSHYGSSGGDLYFLNINGSGNTSANFRAAALNNSGTVAQFGSGFSISQSGDVTKGFSAFGANISGNVGDGTGTSFFGVDLTTTSGKTVDGGVFGLNLNNQADVTNQIFGVNIGNSGSYAGMNGLNLNNTGTMTGNNTLYGASVSNSGTGYRIVGLSVSNNANMSEEIRGVQYNSTGDSRTSTGVDVTMIGNATDDATGVRVNVSSQTTSSTTGHVRSGSFEGGTFAVQGAFTPFDSFGVDIGNNITSTSTINNGSPLTGTDQIIQLFQSNLIAGDDIATGPFGIDTNMIGMLSQVDIGSGKTVPLIRSMLLGTTVPSGSGGTITEHVVLEVLGLPSFGGSVTCPTKIGIQDSQLLGQNFSDGATDTWGIRWRDVNSEHYLARLALNTTSLKVANSSVGLELEGVDKAVLFSRMTTTEKNALTALAGMLVFDTTLSQLSYYDGSVWVNI